MINQTYMQYKPMLFGLAYRMLGMSADAEDIVQEVFIKYMQLDTGEIRDEKAFLTKMTANRCINLLQSSRRQREMYTGPWLPEPLQDNRLLPSDPAERRENIGYAYLVLLQRLTPLERAVYILKEALDSNTGILRRCWKKRSLAAGKHSAGRSRKQVKRRYRDSRMEGGHTHRNGSLKRSCSRRIRAISSRSSAFCSMRLCLSPTAEEKFELQSTRFTGSSGFSHFLRG